MARAHAPPGQGPGSTSGPVTGPAVHHTEVRTVRIPAVLPGSGLRTEGSTRPQRAYSTGSDKTCWAGPPACTKVTWLAAARSSATKNRANCRSWAMACTTLMCRRPYHRPCCQDWQAAVLVMCHAAIEVRCRPCHRCARAASCCHAGACPLVAIAGELNIENWDLGRFTTSVPLHSFG